MLRYIILLLLVFSCSQVYAQCPNCGKYHFPYYNSVYEPTYVPEFTIIFKDSTKEEIQCFPGIDPRNIANTFPNWTWPGILHVHLLKTHRIDTKNWTQEDRIKIHNYMHNSNQLYWNSNFNLFYYRGKN